MFANRLNAEDFQDFVLRLDRQFDSGAWRHGIPIAGGLATLSLREPDRVIYGLDDKPDSEDARILQTIIGGIPIVNTYVPQGSSVGSEKYAFKLEWFRFFHEYLETYLHPNSPAIWVGDLNVAPEPLGCL